MSEPVDLSKINVGDEVLVRAFVKDTLWGGRISLKTVGECFSVPMVAIVSHTPKPVPLAVGDRVRTISGFGAQILAIHENSAWVLLDVGGRTTTLLSNLERLDG